jgi:hypothetical protein
MEELDYEEVEDRLDDEELDDMSIYNIDSL